MRVENQLRESEVKAFGIWYFETGWMFVTVVGLIYGFALVACFRKKGIALGLLSWVVVVGALNFFAHVWKNG